MNETALRKLYGFLAGSGEDFEPQDHVLEVQDGAAVGRLLGASDWVNFLDFDSFRRLVEIAEQP